MDTLDCNVAAIAVTPWINALRPTFIDSSETYSREYNTYRQKIGRQAQGNTELEIEYEKILTRVKKTRESVIRMIDRHYTEPVDEISGTVESASPGGITRKTRSLRPARNTTPRAPAPEALWLRAHVHRLPGNELHESRAGRLSMTRSLHRSTTAASSCPAWGHYRLRGIQWLWMG
jgi:hypothetical protein